MCACPCSARLAAVWLCPALPGAGRPLSSTSPRSSLEEALPLGEPLPRYWSSAFFPSSAGPWGFQRIEGVIEKDLSRDPGLPRLQAAPLTPHPCPAVLALLPAHSRDLHGGGALRGVE